MFIGELITVLIQQAGQYVIDVGSLEIQQPGVENILTQIVLPFIGEYRPYKKDFQITVTSSPYTFTSDIPDWISGVDPVDAHTTLSVASLSREFSQGPFGPTAPLKFIFRYKKPKLYLSHTGQIAVRGRYSPVIISAPTDYPAWQESTSYTIGEYVYGTAQSGLIFKCTSAGTSGAAEPAWKTDISGITTDNTVTWETLSDRYVDNFDYDERHYLFDLLLGHFLIALGRGRKDVIFGELPIDVDNTDMLSNGKDLLEATMEHMRLNSKFWSALE